MPILFVATTCSALSKLFIISTKHNEFTFGFCVSYSKAKV